MYMRLPFDNIFVKKYENRFTFAEVIVQHTHEKKYNRIEPLFFEVGQKSKHQRNKRERPFHSNIAQIH